MLKAGLGKGGKDGNTRHAQIQIPTDVPPEGFWDDFFSDENFQGKTLGEFLNDATPSPATVKAKLSYFDVPHRELFYKEEDLRCFRKDGTYIGDNYPDEEEYEAEAEEAPPTLTVEPEQEESADIAAEAEAEPSSPCGNPHPPFGPLRVLPGDVDFAKEEEHLRVPRGEERQEDPMEVEVEVEVDGLGLNLGAAAFAAASAEYGRSSSSSQSSHSAGLAIPSQENGGGVGPENRPLGGGAGNKSRTRAKGSSATAVSGSGTSNSGRGRHGNNENNPNIIKEGGSQEGVRKSGRARGSIEQQQQQERMGGKRRAGAEGGGFNGAVAETKGGENPTKRRRLAGGVLAPTRSSIGKAATLTAAAAAAATSSMPDDPDVDDTKDPMQKKLLQFRQKKATGSSNAPAKTKGPAVKKSVQTVAAAGRGRPAGSRGRTGVASGTAGAVSRRTVRAKTAASAILLGGVGGGGGDGGDVGDRSDGVFRMGVTAAEAKRNASSRPARNGPKNVPRTNSRTVSKPVTTVKRSVGGKASAAAAAAAGSSGAGVGATGRGSRSARDKSAGVKRKAPALLSGNVTDRKRRPGSRKTKDEKDDSSGLSFDDDLKAKLAEHNRGVTKGRHTYEPSKGRVKDWKKWESQTGKKYYSLKPDEKADANREILAMLAAEKEG